MSKELNESTEYHAKLVSSTISHKVIKGGFWILALRVSNRALGLLRTIILARLLLPEHFGVVGIAAVTISTIETFSQPGLGTALVQKKGSIEDYLDTAWTVSVIRSLLIFLVLYLLASYVAGFFNTPQSQIVLQIFAICVIIAGCRNIGVIYFQKELNFRKQYIYEFSATLGNLIVAIPAAFMLRSVWALVLGAIAGSIMRFIMSYVLHSYRPRMRLEREKFGELFGFGKWVLGSSILVFLVTQGDDIFLGRMFGATALGFYQMAYMISSLPTTEISQVISHVTFPAYAKIQDDPPRFGDAYLKVLQVIAFMAIPLTGGIFILASEFTEVFLGQKWLPIVPLIQVLVWAGLMRALMGTTSPVFYAAGKPRISTRWYLINFVVLGISIYPLSVFWGMIGISTAVLLSNSVATIGCIYETSKILRYDPIRFSKILIFPLVSMFFCLCIVSWINNRLLYDNILELILLVVSGATVYVVATYLFDKGFNYKMADLLKQSLVSLRESHS